MSEDTSQYFKDGNFKLHIFNEKNIPITEKVIEQIFKKYNFYHKIKNLELYQLAMIHISYMNRTTVTDKTAKILKDIQPIEPQFIKNVFPLQDKCYGRLEYRGDAVLHHIIADYLFERYPDEDEGFLTKLRTKLEKADTLSDLSKKLGLDKYAIIARNIEQANGRANNTHLTEDIFEAFFGALSIETTYEECYRFFINIIEKELDIVELIYNDDNYKDRLMQYFHKMKWSEPKYTEDSASNGCGDIRNFIMMVKNTSGQVLGVGEGNSKVKAEQLAAYNSLVKLGVIVVDDINKTSDDYYGELSESDNSDYFEIE